MMKGKKASKGAAERKPAAKKPAAKTTAVASRAGAERPLPRAFHADGETIPLLAKVKARLSKNFRWTRAQSLYDAMHLAVLLLVFGRDDEALEICRALGEYQFTGSYNLWSAVEFGLTLQSRLVRLRGQIEESQECCRRVREAGLAPERLNGILLDRNDSIKESLKTGDKRWEQAARLTHALELALISEMGGSKKCPVPSMEQAFQENLKRLKELTGADQR